jgi:uncharacterized protein
VAGNHCRYYPSCSAYTLIQFEKNNLFKAFVLSLVRILRCNQLFKGGFDYPKIRLRCRPQDNLSINEVKYWLIPEAGDRYIIIKNFSFKG